MPYSALQIWLLAIRPKTLWAAVCPVMIGAAIAYGDNFFHLPSAVSALICALLIQIGTNLANDYFDFKKGADTKERIGPTRVTQAGLVTPQAMQTAMLLVLLLLLGSCFYLVKRGGWPVVFIGISSILSGFFYTAGPRPLGYLGLGELFVFIFFGPVAVAGTYYVQALEWNPVTVLAGIAPGLFSVAILTVNNLRDIENDQRAGKRTLAVRFGRSFAMFEYFFSITGACLVPVVIAAVTAAEVFPQIATVVLFLSYPVIRTIFTKTDGPALNAALAATSRLLLAYTILFSIGWLI